MTSTAWLQRWSELSTSAWMSTAMQKMKLSTILPRCGQYSPGLTALLAMCYMQTQLEIQQAVRAIHQLRQEYDSTLGPLEIAEARIAERQKRPNMEFVHDDASRRLAIEVEEIKAGQVELRKELKKAQEEERALRRTALALKEDVDCKINSINIDNACMQERQQYKYRRIESTLTAKTQGLKL
eukprot:TRINITY_DN10180_c0_g1_i2.p1 TRINITY_DN10180_c0_g1~~TRINITY_DN10180_c0_g1_i2.p1  ORF type:complete len:183 (+),score=42.03 TRINITY_DN10180_c0_g1_i2:405-953(+)